MSFLRAFDSHIPLKDARLWLYPVNLNGIDYGIPLTSKDTYAGTPGYVRCGMNLNQGLNLRYMVPLPAAALMPAKPLDADLKQELYIYEENRKYIEAEAQILRRLSASKQMDRFFMAQSCDYEELESVYYNWQPGFEAGIFLRLDKEEENTMPISKNRIAYFTKEQLKAAQEQTNALAYAQSQGYDLIKENSFYRMREHDSLVFYPNGTFIWNSRGVSGGILNFMIHYENRNLVDAVLSLAGDEEYLQQQPAAREAHKNVPAAAPEKEEEPEKIFRSPSKDENNRKVFYYLCSVRGLDKQVVMEMIRQGALYQSAYRRPEDNKMLTNATFIYRDYQGKAVGAFQRGMVDIPGVKSYKREFYGTNKDYGWLLRGSGTTETVMVFEGAIDAASDASLAAMKGGDAWKKVDRLSMEGISDKGLWIEPLKNYLKEHPHTRNVVLMYDADPAGRAAAASTAKWLREQHPYLVVEDREPPFGKDWNEVLTDTRYMQQEQDELQQSAAAEPTQDYEQEN